MIINLIKSLFITLLFFKNLRMRVWKFRAMRVRVNTHLSQKADSLASRICLFDSTLESCLVNF